MKALRSAHGLVCMWVLSICQRVHVQQHQNLDTLFIRPAAHTHTHTLLLTRAHTDITRYLSTMCVCATVFGYVKIDFDAHWRWWCGVVCGRVCVHVRERTAVVLHHRTCVNQCVYPTVEYITYTIPC